MKIDTLIGKELLRTFQRLDDLLLPSQREEVYRASVQSLEHIVKAVQPYETQRAAISSSMSKALKECSNYQANLISSFHLDETFYDTALIQAMNNRMNILSLIDQSSLTPMLETLRNATLRIDWALYIDTLTKAMKQSTIDAADISFIKLANVQGVMSDYIKLPYGLSTVLDTLNVSAAKTISRDEYISYSVTDKTFFHEHNPKSAATAKELNSICAASQFFDDLNEESGELISSAELMNFMTYLSDQPSFAGNNPTGQRILAIIRDDVQRIDFDLNTYYHARGRYSDDAPYTAYHMLTAPAGMTGPGRYNHPGQAFYYFASTIEGAAAEIRKHEPEKTIQVASIKPSRSICMIDLSGTLKHGAMFLKYIRFKIGDERVPREYLIPNYVSDCCRACNIEGIKYYGSKQYNNYVAWNPSYFQFIEMIDL